MDKTSRARHSRSPPDSPAESGGGGLSKGGGVPDSDEVDLDSGNQQTLLVPGSRRMLVGKAYDDHKLEMEGADGDADLTHIFLYVLGATSSN